MISSLSLLLAVVATPAKATENVLYVMSDGLRWQEIFQGADLELLAKVSDKSIKKQFGGPTPEARREALMPFLWSTIAHHGQLLGNRTKGSHSSVANPLKFTYPGFSESLVGFYDAKINTNGFKPNPNESVLEWLNQQVEFKGKTAAFGASEIIRYVINQDRCNFFVNTGYSPVSDKRFGNTFTQLNQLKAESPRYWDDEPSDNYAYHTAKEYLRVAKPRLFFLALGETDEWAHENKYDLYLAAIHRFDSYLRDLWTTAQAMPQYRGKTTLFVSCDHGRGRGPEWIDHDEKIAGSEETFILMLGAGVAEKGERSSAPSVTNSQIPATIAKLLGYDYQKHQPKAADPIDTKG